MDYSNMKTEDLLKELEKQKIISSQENTNQLSKKLMINSIYGAFGNEHFVLYNPYIADAITAMGRYDIKVIGDNVINKINSVYGDDVVFRNQTDTDSFFICMDKMIDVEITKGRLKDDVKEITSFIDVFDKKVIQPLIQKTISDTQTLLNCYESCVDYDREKICSMLSTGKKRYAVKLYNDEGVDLTSKPKKKIVGLDIKRSSTPADVRLKLDTTIDLMFDGDNNKLIDFIKDYEEQHKKTDLSLIAIPSGVSDITKYEHVDKAVPMHVRASKVMNDMIKRLGRESDYPLIVNGDKIKYVFLKTPNPLKSDVIAFKDPKMMIEFGLVKYINHKHLFERTFISPIETLTEAIGWQLDSGSAAMMDLF